MTLEIRKRKEVEKMPKIILSHCKTFIGLSDDQKIAMRKDLTLPNPKYASAVKYSPYANIAVPEFLTYYHDTPKGFKTPIGFLANKDDLRDFSTPTLVDTRQSTLSLQLDPFTLELRPSQVRAKESFLNKHNDKTLEPHLRSLVQQGVICLKTGKGKSILALNIAHTLKAKALIIVHKDDLVVGWKKDIKKCFGGKVKSGLIKAKSRTVGDFLTIATPQTLNNLPKDELEVLYNTFDLIIHDEVHRAPSQHFSISSKFNARYKVGLSATPERNDGLTQVINFYFGDICYIEESDEADKDILPVLVKIKSFKTIKFDPPCLILKDSKGSPNKSILTKYPYERGDARLSQVPPSLQPQIHYANIERDLLFNEFYGNQVIDDIMHNYTLGRSMVVFISQKEGCELYYHNLCDLVGEDKVQLFYGDSKESNEELLRRAEEKEVLITITTLAKGTEGTNVKSWEVAFLVSSMNNGMGVEQAIGRIRRVKDGKINPCIVYDYRFPSIYAFSRHGATRDKRYLKMNLKTEYIVK